MSDDAYKPPPNGLYFAHPRSLSDLPRKIAVHHFFAVIAYSHYLSLTSESRRYFLEIIQGVAFVFFPFLPIVQFISHAIRLLLHFNRIRETKPGARYILSTLFGMRTNATNFSFSNQRQHSSRRSLESLGSPTRDGVSYPLLDFQPNELDAKIVETWTRKQFFRVVLLLSSMTSCGLSVAAYIKRVNIKWRSATYIATLGFDHRCGWLALGGCAATFMCIPLQIVNRTWSISPRAASIETNVFWEIPGQIIVAALIQDQLLGVTNHPSTFRILLRYLVFRIELVFFWIVVIPLVASKFRRRLPWKLFLVTGLLWSVSVAVIQLNWDVSEVKNVGEGRVSEYNYRWAEKDPKWWSL